jgi:hypothetical protein
MHHSAVLASLLYMPILVMVFLMAMQVGADFDASGARRFVDGYQQAAPETKLAALLLAASAAIHVALIPVHVDEDPTRAVLFAVCAGAMASLAVAAFVTPWWRPAAVVVLVGTIAAYFFYVATGREEIDPIGISTKLIELSALALAVIRLSPVFVQKLTFERLEKGGRR